MDAHFFTLINKFVTVIVSFLLEVTSPSPSLPVTVYGAMNDGDRSRRVYYTATIMQELKWIQLNSDHEEKGRGPMAELLQLLKAVLSHHIPDATLPQLAAACSPAPQQQSESHPFSCGEKNTGFASPDKPLLNLVYNDQSLLTSLLCSVNPTVKKFDQKVAHHAYNLFEGFVMFLKDNCRDLACFVRPVLTILDTAASSGQSLHSDIFLSILGGFTHKTNEDREKESEGKEREREHGVKLLQFIGQGTHTQYDFMPLFLEQERISVST